MEAADELLNKLRELCKREIEETARVGNVHYRSAMLKEVFSEMAKIRSKWPLNSAENFESELHSARLWARSNTIEERDDSGSGAHIEQKEIRSEGMAVDLESAKPVTEASKIFEPETDIEARLARLENEAAGVRRGVSVTGARNSKRAQVGVFLLALFMPIVIAMWFLIWMESWLPEKSTFGVILNLGELFGGLLGGLGALVAGVAYALKNSDGPR